MLQWELTAYLFLNVWLLRTYLMCVQKAMHSTKENNSVNNNVTPVFIQTIHTDV